MKVYYFLAFLPLLQSCSEKKSSLLAEGAELKLVADGYSFTEGPAADADGNVYFTDQPNDRILKWEAGSGQVSTYLQSAGRANGLYVNRNGKLLACADEKFQLWEIDSEKRVDTLVSDFNGLNLNGPNDLWVDPKGGIYFTDPYYQRPYWTRSQKEIEEERVYYLSPDRKELKMVASDLVQPNGIVGTPDGKMLYVADIGAKKTYSYTLAEDGSLGDKTLFTTMGSDGMTLDEEGNLYLTGDGVTVFSPTGEQLLHIPVPEKWTANVTFGGTAMNQLFITAMDSVYTMEMAVKGAAAEQ